MGPSSRAAAVGRRPREVAWFRLRLRGGGREASPGMLRLQGADAVKEPARCSQERRLESRGELRLTRFGKSVQVKPAGAHGRAAGRACGQESCLELLLPPPGTSASGRLAGRSGRPAGSSDSPGRGPGKHRRSGQAPLPPSAACRPGHAEPAGSRRAALPQQWHLLCRSWGDRSRVG